MTESMSLPRGTVPSRASRIASPRTPRVQVVVAHPDDETFGCGPLLLHARASGARTAVACATRGEAGERRDASDGDLGRVRADELRRAAATLGVDRVDLLGFADSGMSGLLDPGTLVAAPFEQVVDAVGSAVEAFAPDVLVTLDGSDGHRDHVRIRDAALAAAQAAGVPRVYLSCLPRSLLRSWADHMRVLNPDKEHLDADTAELGTPDHLVTTRVDVRVHRGALERAMCAHASQASPFDGLPESLRAAFLDVVHARRVVPPWPGGPVETRLVEPVLLREAASSTPGRGGS